MIRRDKYMIKIMNKSKQPLSLNLDGGRGIILLPKETSDLSNDEFKSVEVQSGVNSGSLFVLSIESEAKATDTQA